MLHSFLKRSHRLLELRRAAGELLLVLENGRVFVRAGFVFTLLGEGEITVNRLQDVGA